MTSKTRKPTQSERRMAQFQAREAQILSAKCETCGEARRDHNYDICRADGDARYFTAAMQEVR